MTHNAIYKDGAWVPSSCTYQDELNFAIMFDPHFKTYVDWIADSYVQRSMTYLFLSSN